ncbi:DUF3892 domain-containing protein [Akkermansia glycaniphila]|uniref:DUF3892 domain-containing protein n=1 Tax=Akkermansia glycaniphila TaxID=1679444 RepID=A0A1H6MHP6_9BACT|nr:DUF3892 domain-containing protein [Akkermansia glycaniphila]SEI01174.1 protein of unknown function (duf3892) [Akkermansia glycaniphila]
MAKATKIKLKDGCTSPKSTLEISEIYLEGVNKEGFYTKAAVHDFVKDENVVTVNIGPSYPKLIAVVSPKGEKYVRSEPNDTKDDNLLKLPRV